MSEKCKLDFLGTCCELSYCVTHQHRANYCEIGLKEACREVARKAFLVSPENMAAVLHDLAISQSTGYLILDRIQELRRRAGIEP